MLHDRTAPMPHVVASSRDLVVVEPRLHRLGELLGVPAGDRRLVALVDEQPRAVVAAPDDREPATQLLAEQVEMQLARFDRLAWVLRLGRLPRAPVPDDDVAA